MLLATPSSVPRLHRVLGATAAVAALTFVGACSGSEAGDAPRDESATKAGPSLAPDPVQDELATTDDAAPAAATCTTADRETVDPTSSWEHPSQSFYTGDEKDLPAATDLEHLLRADGAAVVRYRASSLPDASMDALRTWAENGVAVIALPANDDASSPLTVDTVDHTLSCEGLDTVRLDSFLAERDFGDVEAH